MSQSASIDVTKINKEWLFIGKQKPDGSQPKYLSLTIRKNKDGRDQYGNDGMVIQDVPKQFKKEGVKVEAVWGSDVDRDYKLNAYAKKEIQVICQGSLSSISWPRKLSADILLCG